MRTIIVKDLMVPLEEYATVPLDATLYDAIIALEKAQAAFDPKKHKHRAILVLDADGKVVGKISIFDILIALEPKYGQSEAEGVLARSGYSSELIDSMLKDNTLWSEPLNFICDRAPELNVRDFMETPSDGVYIDEKSAMGEAIHQIVIQKHHSLLVTREGEVVGILRLTDVFATICDKIKTC
ncbi:CBS domain-containing protein [Desulfococcaceae bacterium HSG7]|nr:CBS domain-containing protein [Desulfococcaceae bacterium HSG7]